MVTLQQLREAAGSRKPNADQFLAQVVEAHRERLAVWAKDVTDLPLGAPVAIAPMVTR